MAKAADVNLIDHSDEVIAQKDELVNLWLAAIGQDAAATAAHEAPVDTGRLKLSISHAVVEDEKAVYIGTNVPYAPHQEFGTSKGIVGKHFIQFGATAHSSEYKAMLEEALKGD